MWRRRRGRRASRRRRRVASCWCRWQRWRERHRRRRRRRRWQRHRRMGVSEGAGCVGGVATTCGRRAVLARGRQGRWRRRRWRRRRWRRRRCPRRLAVALAVDHVLNVHVASLVRVIAHFRRRRRHEGVRAIWTDGQQHHLCALEEVAAIEICLGCRLALAVHLHAVCSRAHHVLVLIVNIEVGVTDHHTQEALPSRSRWCRRRGWWRQGRWR